MDPKKPLYEFDDKKLYYSDFVKALKELGIGAGDVGFVHSDITTFGKLATTDRNFLFDSLINAMKEAVGEDGTIIMPTFTYSFDKNEVYDIENSKSTVGALTEYFRKQEGVLRTKHPSHSAAIWGNNKAFFVNVDNGTFDENSIFGKTLKKNGKFVFFGTPLSKACTFIHYIEQSYQVPYRYMRKYECKIKNKDREYGDEFSFYYKYSYFFTDMAKLEKDLFERGMLKEVHIGSGKISAIKAETLLHEGLALLGSDIYFFLKNDGIFRVFNFLIYPFVKYASWLAKFLDKITIKILRKDNL